jgi:hypothetical protein
MKWFGEWDAPCTRDPRNTKIDVPTTLCSYCNDPFQASDYGVAFLVVTQVSRDGAGISFCEIAYHHHCMADSLGVDPTV